jgi:hypothetical protein
MAKRSSPFPYEIADTKRKKIANGIFIIFSPILMPLMLVFFILNFIVFCIVDCGKEFKKAPW